MKSRKDISGFSRLDELADFFKIFGDSTRLKILQLLQKDELYVNDISESAYSGSNLPVVPD